MVVMQARVATGKAPLYMVSQYAYGMSSSLRAFGGGPLSFALPVTAKRSSVVTLEAVADSMRLVVNSSPGNISGQSARHLQQMTHDMLQTSWACFGNK